MKGMLFKTNLKITSNHILKKYLPVIFFRLSFNQRYRGIHITDVVNPPPRKKKQRVFFALSNASDVNVAL